MTVPRIKGVLAALGVYLVACLGVASWAAMRPPACPPTVSVATFGPPAALEQGQLITATCRDGQWHLTNGLNADIERSQP